MKSKFRKHLLQGHGKCMEAVRSDPYKYERELEKACEFLPSFDAQCEGTRAWFIYQLVLEYDDYSHFLEAAMKSFKKCRTYGSWKFSYLTELLNYFAGDGNIDAKNAIDTKYEELYSSLLTGRVGKAQNQRIEGFEMMCVILSKNLSSFLKIAADIGRLYTENSSVSASDFGWFYDCKAERYHRALLRNIKASPYIKRFEDERELEIKEMENIHNDFNKRIPKSGAPLSWWLKRHDDKNLALRYADIYENEENPEKRSEILYTFCMYTYPKNPKKILDDTKSNCDALRTAAWAALGNINNSLVREYALNYLQNNMREKYKAEMTDILPVLIRNYVKKDEKMLIDMVESIPIDINNKSGWHGIHTDVLGMEEFGLKAPVELLKFIVENSFCSCCRMYAIEQLGKRRKLSDNDLHVFLFDCNYEIRCYAKQCLRRRSMVDKLK